MRNGGTFLVDVVVAAVLVEVVNVSSTEKVSASLYGSASSPHCLQKHVRNLASTFLSILLDHESQTTRDTQEHVDRSISHRPNSTRWVKDKIGGSKKLLP